MVWDMHKGLPKLSAAKFLSDHHIAANVYGVVSCFHFENRWDALWPMYIYKWTWMAHGIDTQDVIIGIIDLFIIGSQYHFTHQCTFANCCFKYYFFKSKVPTNLTHSLT